MSEAPPPYNPQQQGYPPQQPYPTAPDVYPPQQPYPTAPDVYPPQQPYPTKSEGYPPPQTGYPPPQQQTTTETIVVTTQPTVVANPVFRDYPVVITLADGSQVQTKVTYRAGMLTWLICITVCVFLCSLTVIFGVLGLVAFCIPATKDVYHLDPAGNVVGVYKRL